MEETPFSSTVRPCGSLFAALQRSLQEALKKPFSPADNETRGRFSQPAPPSGPAAPAANMTESPLYRREYSTQETEFFMPKAQLSELLAALSGSFGDLVVSTGKRGTVVRQKPTYARVATPDQKEGEARFQTAGKVWSSFTSAEAEGWNRYALTLLHTNSLTGERYSPTGYNVFLSLTLKFLQINPGESVPRTPPASGAPLDAFLLLLTPGAEGVVFTAEGQNTPGVKTEILLQTLPNPRRKPTSKYVSKGFFTFTALSRRVGLPVPPGAYAGAYRFVNAASGTMSPLITLGKIEVTQAAAGALEQKAA